MLGDSYAWLEAHSSLSDSYVTTSTASAMEANTSSLNTNTTLLNSMIISTNMYIAISFQTTY